MKKNILIGILLCVTVIFAGCGSSSGSSSQPKEAVKDGVFTTKADGYQSQIDKVISANDELEPLKITQSASGDDSETTTLYMEYDGESIGFLMVKANDEGYIQSVSTAGSTQVASSEIYAMMTAAFMALDSDLSYEDADDIAQSIVDIYVLGGDGVSKNGIMYDYVMEYESENLAVWAAYPAENAE